VPAEFWDTFPGGLGLARYLREAAGSGLRKPTYTHLARLVRPGGKVCELRAIVKSKIREYVIYDAKRVAHSARPRHVLCLFLNLRHFKFAAPAIHGVQPVERHCHSQPKEQTIAPGGPAKLGPDRHQHHG
jgi:hypothetical protein